MRPDFVVIRSVSLQDIAQVRFAEHDEVVECFAANRTDQPLNVPVLPRRAWRRRAISDPHCANASGVRWTERAVAVANQMTRRFVPGKGIDHLSRDPLGGRVVRHADAHQSPSGVAKNYQAIEQLERDSANHEQIDRRDPRGVIAQECFPTLGGRSLPPDHVPRHGRFGDFDAEHEQFAVYPWRSPQWVFLFHPSDEFVDLAVDSGAAPTPAGFPAPIGAKAAPMPADHGLRLNHSDHIQNRGEQLVQPYKDQPVATKNSESVEKSGVFGFTDAISPGCLSSCDRSSVGLDADSAVGQWWN